MLRLISLSFRKLHARKDNKRTLTQFEQWKQEILLLDQPVTKGKKLLIIRLDDIGDYLLFRNNLVVYRQSSRWASYEITLLGFSLWRELNEYADSEATDHSIWINKKDYFNNNAYRLDLWKTLRAEGFEVVICPSRVRPLLLDDMCMLAAGAPLNIAGTNDFGEKDWNKFSDALYQELFVFDKLCHEFIYNNAFTKWCCGNSTTLTRPQYPVPQLNAPGGQPYIICFIGASFKSRRWTTERWIELINILNNEKNFRVVVAGGKNDMEIAGAIETTTGVENITGKVSLVEMANWIANSIAVISNDTMAAHLAIALNKPTIIVTSGDNFYKFSAYKEAGIKGVISIYPEVFMRKWKKHHYKMFRNHVAVTNDIGTITAEMIFNAFKQMAMEQYQLKQAL